MPRVIIDTWVRWLLLGLIATVAYLMLAMAWIPNANAAPASPNVFSIAQPDGDSFSARQFGDEWYNGVETAFGHTVIETRGGYWKYAVKADNGSLRPSGRVVGEDPAPDVRRHLRDRRELERAETLQSEPAASGSAGAPSMIPAATGSHDALVILAQFNDHTNQGSTAAQWNSKFFGATDSVKDYYEEVSYGNFSITPATESSGTFNDGVVGWVTLPMNHPNQSEIDGINKTVTLRAIQAANPFVNFASFDTNGNGFISASELHVTVIVAGHEAAFSPRPQGAKVVWGHRWSLDAGVSVDGKNIGGYQNGAGGYTQFGETHNTHMATIGIMAHELGHDINLPDLYDAESEPTSEGIGNWSLMAGGSWLFTQGEFHGETPAHPDAWSKSALGWVSPQRVQGTATLAVDDASLNPDVVQLLANPNGVEWNWGTGATGEYFLIENRQKTPGTYDEALPGCGLLVWHIDESRASNSTDARRLVDLEEADGLDNLDEIPQSINSNRGDAGDPYPGTSNKTWFTGTTNPNSNLYGGTASGASLTNISSGCTSSMTADFAAPGSNSIPDNNDLGGARFISGAAGRARGSNTGANKEASEPNHAATGGPSVWFQWTAPDNRTMTFDTSGSDFDTLLAAYTGTGFGNFVQVASNDDSTGRTSAISFAATQNTTYYIAIDGYSGAQGAYQLDWSGALASDVGIALGKSTLPGPQFSYTATVVNNGPNPAPGVFPEIALPRSVAFVSHNSSVGTCGGSTTITCSFGTMAPGAQETVEIVVEPLSPGPSTATATVTTNGVDTQTGNDSASEMADPGFICDGVGDASDETFIAAGQGDILCGFGGDDTISGGGGNDLIFGGPGNDTLKGQVDADDLYGGGGRDSLYGGPANDALQGGRGSDLCRDSNDSKSSCER